MDAEMQDAAPFTPSDGMEHLESPSLLFPNLAEYNTRQAVDGHDEAMKFAASDKLIQEQTEFENLKKKFEKEWEEKKEREFNKKMQKRQRRVLEKQIRHDLERENARLDDARRDDMRTALRTEIETDVRVEMETKLRAKIEKELRKALTAKLAKENMKSFAVAKEGMRKSLVAEIEKELRGKMIKMREDIDSEWERKIENLKEKYEERKVACGKCGASVDIGAGNKFEFDELESNEE